MFEKMKMIINVNRVKILSILLLALLFASSKENTKADRNKNSAYKEGITHTTGRVILIHQDGFHSGLR